MISERIARWAIAALCLAGLAVATYLSVQHVTGGIPACGISSGCDTVTTSEYAALMGVPVAIIGVAGYATILLGTLAYLGLEDPSQQSVIRPLGNRPDRRGLHLVFSLHAGLSNPRLLRILSHVRRNHDRGARSERIRDLESETGLSRRARVEFETPAKIRLNERRHGHRRHR